MVQYAGRCRAHTEHFHIRYRRVQQKQSEALNPAARQDAAHEARMLTRMIANPGIILMREEKRSV